MPEEGAPRRAIRVSPYYFENAVGLVVGSVGLVVAFLFAVRIREARDAGMFAVVPQLIGLALLVGGAGAGAAYTALKQRGVRINEGRWPMLTTVSGKGPDVSINHRLDRTGATAESPLDFFSRFVPGSDDAPLPMQIILQRYLRPLIVIVGLMLAYGVCLVFVRNDLDAAIINLVYLGLLGGTVFQLARPEIALNRRVIVGTWLLAIVLPIVTSLMPTTKVPAAIAGLSHAPTIIVFLAYAVTASVFLYASTLYFRCPPSYIEYLPHRIVSNASPEALFRQVRRETERFGLLAACYRESAPKVGNEMHGRFDGVLMGESVMGLDTSQLPTSPAEMFRVPRLRLLTLLTAVAGLCWVVAFALAWSFASSLIAGTPSYGALVWLVAAMSIGWWAQQSAHLLWGWIPFTSRMVLLTLDGHYSRAATQSADRANGTLTERNTLASDNTELRVRVCDVESVCLGLSGPRLPVAYKNRVDLAEALQNKILAELHELYVRHEPPAGAPRVVHNTQQPRPAALPQGSAE